MVLNCTMNSLYCCVEKNSKRSYVVPTIIVWVCRFSYFRTSAATWTEFFNWHRVNSLKIRISWMILNCTMNRWYRCVGKCGTNNVCWLWYVFQFVGLHICIFVWPKVSVIVGLLHSEYLIYVISITGFVLYHEPFMLICRGIVYNFCLAYRTNVWVCRFSYFSKSVTSWIQFFMCHTVTS